MDHIATDIAFTINVRPYRLGSKAESNSLVLVPESSQLDLYLAENVHKWYDGQSTTKSTLVGGEVYPIPTMIERLEAIQPIKKFVVSSSASIKISPML